MNALKPAAFPEPDRNHFPLKPVLSSVTEPTPVWLDSEIILPASVADNFRRDGHVTVNSVLAQNELADFRSAVLHAANAVDAGDNKPMAERTTYEKAFQKYMNLWARVPAIRPYVLARRFSGIAAQLLGVDKVRIYHDQGLFKEPGGGPTPWHQDQFYWPLDTDKTVTMWMPLVDITADMGMLSFASGSHRDGYLGDLPISDQSDQVFENFVHERGFSISRNASLNAGDATFHYGWTLHSAPGNLSEKLREVMTIIWVADGARVTEPVNPNQVRDMARWMPGLKPGQPVASALNPLAGELSHARRG